MASAFWNSIGTGWCGCGSRLPCLKPKQDSARVTMCVNMRFCHYCTERASSGDTRLFGRNGLPNIWDPVGQRAPRPVLCSQSAGDRVAQGDHRTRPQTPHRGVAHGPDGRGLPRGKSDNGGAETPRAAEENPGSDAVDGASCRIPRASPDRQERTLRERRGR